MGFSVSSSFIIIVIALMLGTGLFISTAGNTVESFVDATTAAIDDDTARLETDIEVTDAVYHYDGNQLDITLENTGSRPIELSNTDFILDGEYHAGDSFDVATVDGDPSTDVIQPKETLTLVRDESRRFDRVKVVTEHGVTAYSDVRIEQDATILEPNPSRAHVVSTHNSSIVAVGDTVGNDLDTYTLDYSNAPGIGLADIETADVTASVNGTSLTVDSVSNSNGQLDVSIGSSYTLQLGDKVVVNVTDVRNPNASGAYDVPITLTAGSETETDTATLDVANASKAMLYADDPSLGATTGHDAYFLVEQGDSVVGEHYTEFEIDYDNESGTDVSSVTSSDVTIEIDRGGDGSVDVTQTDPSIDTSTDPLTVTFNGEGTDKPAVQAGDVVRVRVAANVQNPDVPGNYTVPITVYSEPDGDLGDPQTTTTADANLHIPGFRPWPMFGLDAENTGHADDVYGPVTDASLRWSTATNGEVRSSPSIKGDHVYVGSNDGNVYALDRTDGDEVWRFVTDGKVLSAPAADDDTLYVGSNDGNVYALDRESGTEQWSFSTGGKVQAGPTVVGDTVYAASLDGTVYALNASTGAKEWEYTAGSEIYTTPAVSGGTVYVAAKGDKSVYAISTSDGSEQWVRNLGGESYDGVAVNDSRVYVGTTNKELYALHAGNGSTVSGWPVSVNSVRVSPAVADGVVYVGGKNKAYAFDASNASKLWEVKPGGEIDSSPAVVSDTVYVGTNDGSVYALNTTDGGTRWSFATGGEVHSSPAVTNGVVYVGSKDGSLYALD